MRNTTGLENGFATLFRRYRRGIFLLFGVAIVIACLYARFAPKSYKVETVLEVRGLNDDFMNTRDVNPTGGGMIDQTYIETQVRLMQNEAVTARVVQAMTASSPSHAGASVAAEETLVRKALASMKVKEEGSSNLVRISLTGSDPQLTADTANQLAQQYIGEQQDARLSEATETDSFLRQQLNEAKNKLQGSEDALQQYAHDSGIILTGDSQESVASEHLREVQQGLAQAEVDSASREARLDVARHSSSESLPEVVNDPTIREDQSRLRDLRVQLADLSTTMTPENYKVQKIQAQIQDLEREMAIHRSTIVERLTMEQHEASRRTALLEDQYKKQLVGAMDQGSKQVRYNVLRNDLDVNRQIYQTLAQKVKEAGVVAAMRTPNARVVSAATAPNSPSAPSLAISLALAILLASIASVLYIILSERHNLSLRAPGETEAFLPNAELAAIPRVHAAARRLANGSLSLAKPEALRNHPMLEHWSSHDGTILAEAFRMAGTSILLRTDGGIQSKVLLITSPRPQSGKTMSSANLAISLAEGSRRVLVVDGDLRKSGLSRLFGFEQSPGLSEALSESRKEDPMKLIRSTEFRGVWVLPSGTVQENAAKLLQSDRLRVVIERLRADFDFVLLDGPPLLELADARLLGKCAGGRYSCQPRWPHKERRAE
jgi:capsular exopolysaccharide synthesis family protein